jgi:hypothetical protein
LLVSVKLAVFKNDSASGGSLLHRQECDPDKRSRSQQRATQRDTTDARQIRRVPLGNARNTTLTSRLPRHAQSTAKFCRSGTVAPPNPPPTCKHPPPERRWQRSWGQLPVYWAAFSTRVARKARLWHLTLCGGEQI